MILSTSSLSFLKQSIDSFPLIFCHFPDYSPRNLQAIAINCEFFRVWHWIFISTIITDNIKNVVKSQKNIGFGFFFFQFMIDGTGATLNFSITVPKLSYWKDYTSVGVTVLILCLLEVGAVAMLWCTIFQDDWFPRHRVNGSYTVPLSSHQSIPGWHL